LMAALLAQQHDQDVYVYDRVDSGTKPDLVRELGATYCTDLSKLPDSPEIVIECTGAGAVIAEVLKRFARNAIVCLTGLSSGAHVVEIGVGKLNDSLVQKTKCYSGPSTPTCATTKPRATRSCGRRQLGSSA